MTLHESKHSGGQIKRRMIKKKLRKAIFYCKVLREEYGRYFTSKDNIELKVLAGVMEAAYHMEKRRFREAKEELMQTIRTVTQLQEGVSLIERAHLQEIIDNSKQNLRFCKFQLKEFDAGEEEILVGVEDQQQMQDILRLRAERSQAKVLDVFGEAIDIEDKALGRALDKVDLLRKSLEASVGLPGEEELLWELMNTFDEAVKRAKQNKGEAGNNVALSSIWERIESYLQMTKHMYLLRRNMVILDTYQKRHANQKEVFSQKERKMDRRPQERARLIDIILESLRTVRELHAKLATAPSVYLLLENYLRGVKCLNISRLFYRNEMYKEALSLHHQVDLLVDSSRNNARFWENLDTEISSFDGFFAKFAPAQRDKTPFSLKEFFADSRVKLDTLESTNKVRRNMAKVALVNQQQTQMEALNLDFMDNMKMKQVYTKSAEINSLFDLIAQNRPREEHVEPETAKDKNNHLDFVRVPPLNKLVAPKPIMLDIAYDFIDFPKKPIEKLREESPEKPASKIGGFIKKFWG